MQFETEVTLVVMLKRPLPGYGKQRLARTLGRDVSWQLAHGLLACALEDAALWPGEVVLSPSRPEDAGWAKGLLKRSVRVLPQGEGNLGERLQLLDEVLHAGGATTLYMGSDAAALQPLHFASAVRALEQSDVALAAADDGGVVLMGNRMPWPDLAPLPWSTDRLGQALHEACIRHGLKCEWTAPGYDIDLESDLRRLTDDLVHDLRPARQKLYRLLLPIVDRVRSVSFKES